MIRNQTLFTYGAKKLVWILGPRHNLIENLVKQIFFGAYFYS